MKIALISTLTENPDQGIRNISASLKGAGHETKTIFMMKKRKKGRMSTYYDNYTNYELEQLYDLCKDSKLIGVSSFTYTNPKAIKICEYLKDRLPNIKIIWGGIAATVDPEECIKYADIICVGEGEEAIVELAEAIEKGKSFDKIKNLWIRKGEKIIKNPVRDLIDDVDILPFPDYEIENHYILQNGKIRNFEKEDLGISFSFLSGRGCPYGCDYCCNNVLNELYIGKRKKIVRFHSTDYIINNMLIMKERFPNIQIWALEDDTFPIRDIKLLKDFCKNFKKKISMNFRCFADFKTITDEKMSLLVDSGCSSITFGIQACERVNREIYHRYITEEEIIKGDEMLSKYKDKVIMDYDVITCNPYETKEDLVSLINLLKRLKKPYRVYMNNLTLFPGTNLYKKMINDGMIKTFRDTALDLRYSDRAGHILRKKKNIYLNLILNMMRGVVTEKKYGRIPKPIFDFFLKEERVEKYTKHQMIPKIATRIIGVFDLLEEYVVGPIFVSLIKK